MISKKDLAASPGTYPVYSSAKENDGKFGEYGHYMFDEELITWSVDGGGSLFHRPKHRFSITNVGGFVRVLDKQAVDCRYLFFVLSWLHSQVQFDWVRKAHPSVIRKVYTAFPLPPLEEQKRIVAVLDQAFAALDRARALAEANLADAEETFRLQRESMLDGTAKGWTRAIIGEICDRFEYGTSAKSQPKGQMPVLRMGNLQGGRLDWSDLVFTDNADDIRKLRLEAGDVLFNRTNSIDHVGKTAIYRGERPAIFAGYLIRLHRKKSLVDAEFLNLYLNSDRAREYGRSVMGKSVNQANISASKLASYPIALPTLAEQVEIARSLNMLAVQVDGVRARYQAKLSELADLRQSLLQKAFAGELT